MKNLEAAKLKENKILKICAARVRNVEPTLKKRFIVFF